jgi:hypothetical protein
MIRAADYSRTPGRALGRRSTEGWRRMDQPFAVAEVVGVVPDVIPNVADTSQRAAGLLLADGGRP